MKRSILLILAVTLAASEPAHAFVGALFNLFKAGAKPAAKTFSSVGRTAATTSAAEAARISAAEAARASAARAATEGTFVFRESGTASDDLLRGIGALPDNELVAPAREVPTSILGQKAYLDDVASTWPESTRPIIRTLEKNGIESQWRSLKGYRELAAQAKALEAGGSKITALTNAKLYSLKLARSRFALAQARRALEELVALEPSRLKTLLPPELGGGLENYLASLKSAEEIHQAFYADYVEAKGSAGFYTKESPPGWDEDGWLGYLLNRRPTFDARWKNAEKLLDQLRPLTGKFNGIDGIPHWTKARCEPSKLVDFSGVLEKSVKQAVKKDVGRFRIVAPADEVAASFEATGAILQTSVDDVAVVNLLPKTKADAAVWEGYSTGDRSSYVEWGQRIDMTVRSRNIASISNTADQALVVQQLKEAAANKRVVVIIGEAYGNHHVRLPGKGYVAVNAIREALPQGTQVVGLFCGSADSLTQVPGLAVQGKMQASEAAGILRAFLTNVNTAQPMTVRDILPMMAGLAKATGEKVHDTFLYLANNQEILVVIGGVSVSGYVYLTQDEEPSEAAKEPSAASLARMLVD